MNEDSEQDFDRKASKTKTIIFLVVLGVILLIATIFVQAVSSPGANPMMDNGAMPSTNQQRSADPVKDSTGPNSDTMPSPTGTGPGSDNSLLSQ